MNSHFQLRNLDDVHYFLGIQVDRIANGLFLHQSKYAFNILLKLGMAHYKPITDKNPCYVSTYNRHSATANVSSTSWLITILDDNSSWHFILSQQVISVYALSSRTSHTTPQATLMLYSRNSPTWIIYTLGPLFFHAYSDADWAGNTDEKRFTTGLTIFLRNSLINWKVQKQRIVGRSSTKAEYWALVVTIAEIVWLRRLAKDFGIQIPNSCRFTMITSQCLQLLEIPFSTPKWSI